MTIRCAIVGPTGYTGFHLIDLLLRHPEAELTYLASHRDELPDIRAEFPSLSGRLDKATAMCKPIDPDAIAEAADVAFLALPHRAAMAYAPQFVSRGMKVIDLSADYRLQDPSLYEEVYDTPHEDPETLISSVYGLPELFRGDVRSSTKLIANPGCYPTASALALAPLIEYDLIDPESIFISAASGASGAGRSAGSNTHFPELNESFYAYGRIGGHRHQPEIAQSLSTIAGRPVDALFVPHLLPIDRGILCTIHARPNTRYETDTLNDAFRQKYDKEPFIRLRKTPPNVKHCRDTNFVDLHWKVVTVNDEPRVIIFAAEDNLIKGASGQAVQNMNLWFGLDETTGLI